MSKINSFALILIIAISLSSCSDKSANKNLFNTWRIESIKPTKSNPPLENYINQQLPMMKYMQRITYNADGTFNEAVGPRSSKGAWDTNKDGKVIYSTNETGSTIRYLNVNIDKDKFTYQILNGQDTLTFTWVPFSAKDTAVKPAMPQMPQAHGNPQDDQPQGEAPADNQPAQGQQPAGNK